MRSCIEHMNTGWHARHSRRRTRHIVVAVCGIANTLSKLASADPLGEKVRRHVSVVDLADTDELVVHTLHLHYILFKERFGAVGGAETVEDLDVRERVTTEKGGALGRRAEASVYLACIDNDVGAADVGVGFYLL